MNGLHYAIEYMKLRILYLEAKYDLVTMKGDNPSEWGLQLREAKYLRDFLVEIKQD